MRGRESGASLRPVGLRRPAGLRRVLGLVTLAIGLVSATHAARGEDDVLVNIRGPLLGKVGDRVTYDVEIVNRSGRSLTGLRIIDYFDKGFRHDASDSPIEQKGTIDLAVGTARRITLDFTLVEAGRQCHRVEILDPSQRFVGGATECVQVSGPVAAAAPLQPPPAAQSPATAPSVLAAPPVFTPPTEPATPPLIAPPPSAPPSTLPPLTPPPVAAAPLTAPIAAPAAAALALDFTGPLEAVSGTVTEFIATVRNTGNAASTPTVLEMSWDNGLVPLEASDGYALAGSRLTWNLPPIEAGGQLRRQVNLRAEPPAGMFSDSPPVRACVRVELSGLPGGARLGDDECLQIRSTTPRPRRRTPSEAGLRLSLADLDDPVRLGDATTLVCTVSNDGDTSSGPLDIMVDLPQGARLVGDARVRVDGGRVMFDTIDVPPRSFQVFQIAYTLLEAGRGTATATLSGANLDGRLERSCQTDFLRP
jgi:hypothetical protein